MSNRARRIRLHGLEMIVVDYTIISTTSNKDGRVQEISQITQGLKALKSLVFRL